MAIGNSGMEDVIGKDKRKTDGDLKHVVVSKTFNVSFSYISHMVIPTTSGIL